MTRRICLVTAMKCSFVCLGYFLGVHSTVVSAGDYDDYELSPSDVPAHSVSARVSAKDEPWMRGLDSVTGTEDLVGSGSLPAPLTERYFSSPIEEPPYVHPPQCPCCANETPLTRFRKGLYQGSSLTGGHVSDGGGDGLGITHYEATVRFGVPFGGMDNVVVIAPSFRQEIIDSPTTIDISGNLYVASVNFTWMKKYSDRWRSLAMVAPSVRSDFNSSDDAVRIFGLGLMTRTLIPQKLEASFGFVYLDRDDISLLPAFGVSWTPKPWWNIDLNFPRPRIAYRTHKQAGFSETWVYTGVALGGNTWAVERANGDSDILTLRDYQWIFGWEKLREGGRGMFAEAGFAFGRSLEYERGGEQVDFDSSVFFRLGINL
jgi:hypothetical protein